MIFTEVHLGVSLRNTQNHPKKVFEAISHTLIELLCSWMPKMGIGKEKTMASYHVKIKTDKKPDGTRIVGEKHNEYLQRIGKFEVIEQQEINGIDNNYMHSNDWKMEIPDKRTVIYQSAFGDIFLSVKGIQVTDNASIQTIALAFELSKHLFDNKISVSGNQKFKSKAVISAAEMGSDFEFTDKNFHNLYKKELNINAGKNGIGTGIREYKARTNDTIYEQYPQSAEGIARSEAPFTASGNGMSLLSGSELDADKLQIEQHLPSYEQQAGIWSRLSESHPELRYDVHTESRTRIPEYRIEQIKNTANSIIYSLKNEINELYAASHLQYINRDAAFKKRGGCIYKGHHLPPWADDNPLIFFQMADKYERNNGCKYKEFELNLPNELNLDQQLEIINKFLDKHFKNHYYAYAVHLKIGALSEGELHPHVHLMFSEREIDELERTAPRPPELFFRRYNSKDPSKGGCRKPEKWIGKNRRTHLIKIRKDFADFQNQILEKYGFTSRVDHRSLEEQRIEALKNNDIAKAAELDRPAETTIDLADARDENNPRVKALKKFRKNRQEAKNASNAITLLKTENEISEINRAINDALKSHYETNTDKNVIPEIQEIITELEEYQTKLESSNKHEADFLIRNASDPVKKAWKKMLHYGQIKKQNTLIINDMSYPDLHDYAASENRYIDKELRRLALIVRPFFIKRKSRDVTKMVRFNQANLLKSKSRIIELSQKIKTESEKRLIRLEDISVNHGLTLKDLYSYILKEIALNKQEMLNEELKNEKFSKQWLTENRAYLIAQNIYTKGAIKDLNHRSRQLKKSLTVIKKLEETLADTKSESRKTQLKSEIERLTEAYKSGMNAIENELKSINKRCQKPEAQKRIYRIMLGIIRKNKSQLLKATNKRKISNLEKKNNDLIHQLKRIKSLENTHYAKSRFALSDFNHPYLAKYPAGSRAEKTIIDALCGDVVSAALTMHLDDYEKKDWKFLSVFEKDKLLNEL